MNKKHIRAAVVGASGYSGEELVHLLIKHPNIDLTAVTSRQYAGKTLAQIFPRFAGYPVARSLNFTQPVIDDLAAKAEVVFLALPHGVAAEFAVPLLEKGCRVIDLSADFRLRCVETYKTFYAHEHPAPELLEKAVYGLPEFYRTEIKTATLIASPGCYPTSILLPTLPLLKAGLISPSGIVANSLSGVSGAGRKAELDYLFCECHESMRPYGVPMHRHLSEIEQELSIAAGTKVIIQFTPHLIPVNRGIITTVCLTPAKPISSIEDGAMLCEAVAKCYRHAYMHEPFVRMLEGKSLPDTKNVVGTNFIEIAWRLDNRTGHLMVMSAEDNIVKGAGGQAIQAMNIQYGLPETAGLI